MRKLILVLFAMALTLGLSSGVRAAVPGGIDTTWTVVESPGAYGLWPNEANSPNIFQADTGLLGRVVTEDGAAVTDPGVANACELAPSYPCAPSMPPVFLLPAGTAETAKPSSGSGGGNECNVKVNACSASTPPGPVIPAAHAGDVDGIGTYSYFVLHEVGGTKKGIGFFSGSYSVHIEPYLCNDCPITGSGQTPVRGPNTLAEWQKTLDNTSPGAVATTTDTSLWITQAISPFGHARINLIPDGAGPGKVSACGNGVVFQTLDNDLCNDGEQPPLGNYLLEDQAVVLKTYSVDMANHAPTAKCNAPDCYVEKVIIPAALAQDPDAKNVQVQIATTILPITAPEAIQLATVDTLIFSYTTQLLDMDEDGIEDRNDACPNFSDATNACDTAGTGCGPGLVACANDNGDLDCMPPQLCNNALDVNHSCEVEGGDLVVVGGANVEGFGAAFGSTVIVGPFDP